MSEENNILLEKDITKYVKVYKLITADECKNIIADLNNVEWRSHAYSIPGNVDPISFGEKELSVAYFDIYSTNHQLLMSRIYQALASYINDIAELGAGHLGGWSGYSSVRINKYEKGQEMKSHIDHISTLFTDGIGVPILTILGSLNKINDYKGGRFIMWGDTEVTIDEGEIAVFPSNLLFPHEVTTIEEGIRYSFVSWAW